MVNIVVGGIHEGKTTKIIALYDEVNQGDGFACVKRIVNNQVIGYDALQLSSRKKYPFILKAGFLPEDWESCLTLGPYSFSSKTLEFIEEQIEEMLKKQISPIFLDEIGLLELENKCFDSILRKILAHSEVVYIATREQFLEKIIMKYEIKQKQIIHLS
jgi:nucleoside-triphosphatase THEP1